MVVDGQYYGGLTVNSAVELLHKIAAGDKPAEPAKSGGRRKPIRGRQKA